MKANNFISKYFQEYTKCLSEVDYNQIIELSNLLKKQKRKNKKVILIGNGGSSSISSHVANDLSKLNKIIALDFSNVSMITCYINDYGNENWMKKALEINLMKDDLLIAISSSGKSKNIIKSCDYAKKNKINLVTLTGFYGKNKISKIGNLNIVVDSYSYNIIENIHQIILLMANDLVYGKMYYSSKA